MPMTRVSDSVLHSADQLKARIQAIAGGRAWRGITRDVQFAVALRAASDCTDPQLAAIVAALLEESGETDEPDPV